ncbi:hypothetical protein CTR2_R15460 [Comamonas thiooxydans]|uniref:hypothetical protein n=1 Tax=Comamonas TaxID=283 RepID=UPI0001DA6CB3|nr:MULTISPECIES: hypothetical protein [Comamonas]TFF54505.1 hypothetical protein EIC84_25060 [Comamonas sp. A23]EFI63684.1 hypothetical protein CTS44_00726 [Comamonas thiooxydans]EHN65078.1 hypothetical protein CTATCC11996_14793 [Comamonas testosteroni ATCC 11996]KKI12343.1 hypothetical protein XA67_20180 [Comamonas thiooxydans]QQN69512.1 hypothetical protein IYN88_22990 [Comamonas testosteroni]
MTSRLRPEVYLSGNPIPISTPSFLDTLKLMFFITDGLPAPQQQGKPRVPKEKNEEEQQQQRKQ